MSWTVESLAALNRVVERKFDELQARLNDDATQTKRREVLDEWKKYLKLHGIDRQPATFKKRGSGKACVWLECPWSVQNSTPGAVYTKSNLLFSMDLAEKILVLEQMPP